MSTSFIVSTEDDPTPLVRIMATTLRRSAEDPKRARAMTRMRGALVFRSANDPQAVTMRFDGRGAVRLTRGVAADAKVTITADLATINEPDAPKPAVAGALAHLPFALGAAKALDPVYGTWQDEARRFWATTAGRPGMPTGITVVCLDDGASLTVGVDPPCEIHASAFELRNLFTGNTTLGERAFADKVYAVGPLNYLATLTGVGLRYAMGV